MTAPKRSGSGLWMYFIMFCGAVSLISLSQVSMGTQLIRVAHNNDAPLVPGLTEWRNDALDRFKKAHPQIEDKLFDDADGAVVEEANKPDPADEQAETANKPPQTAEAAAASTEDKKPPYRKPKDTVIYAIAVTDCPADDNNHVLHGAAVLAESIKNNSIRRHVDSKYDYALYAFVHEDAQACNAALYSLGYAILNGKSPHDAVDKEYIKVYALSLTNHRISVTLEVDTLILQPLDELFDLLLERTITEDLRGNIGELPPQVDFMSTKTVNKLVDHSFFIARTSQDLYKTMAERIEQETDKTKSFDDFLNDVYGEDHFELDHCIYNTYVTDESCRKTTTFGDIQLAHFSSCGSGSGGGAPWTCPSTDSMSEVCRKLHQEWHRNRQLLDIDLGNAIPNTEKDDASFGYCTEGNSFEPIKINIVNPDMVR